jgi:hypothetical protein
MDTRRLDTLGAIQDGVLNRRVTTDIPEDRPQFEADVQAFDDSRITTETDVIAALERGDVVKCAEYYGIPVAWKDETTYQGRLLQYRSVTESPTFENADACAAWFLSRAYACIG